MFKSYFVLKLNLDGTDGIKFYKFPNNNNFLATHLYNIV